MHKMIFSPPCRVQLIEFIFMWEWQKINVFHCENMQFITTDYCTADTICLYKRLFGCLLIAAPISLIWHRNTSLQWLRDYFLEKITQNLRLSKTNKVLPATAGQAFWLVLLSCGWRSPHLNGYLFQSCCTFFQSSYSKCHRLQSEGQKRPWDCFCFSLGCNNISISLLISSQLLYILRSLVIIYKILFFSWS